ncbi:unnamed protein product [Callosobruchus maculatus]|uniref:Uncharacterized protein n=1 Tax=Callosobruchus maculatus TaxID=64391 RepID=A0A653CQG8_CALMS|nr:unnamed protein product [Callosobruchus maculatus]
MDHLKRKMRKLEKEFRKRHDDAKSPTACGRTLPWVRRFCQACLYQEGHSV